MADAPTPRILTDAEGGAWPLELTLPAIEEVNRVLGVNVLDALSGHAVDAASRDMVAFGRAMLAAFEVPPEKTKAFFRGLRGAALRRAWRLFWDNVGDFLPEGGGEALAALLDRSEALRLELARRVVDGLAEVDADRLLETLARRGPEDATA